VVRTDEQSQSLILFLLYQKPGGSSGWTNIKFTTIGKHLLVSRHFENDSLNIPLWCSDPFKPDVFLAVKGLT
jgi:hypothetical protein